MKNYKYLLIAAAATVFAACSNDGDNPSDNSPVAAQISAGVSRPSSRAVDNVWEQDEIGVMVTDAPDSDMETIYRNVQYTTTATTNGAANFTAINDIYFQDADEEVTFAAYGPYQESAANALPGNNGDGIIESSTADQSSRDQQGRFDYIYASGAKASHSNPIVSFSGDNQFKHVMTRLVIIVKPGDDITESDITGGSYALSGLNHNGQFDITTGTAEATGTTLTDNWSLTDYSLTTEGETAQRSFTSILYPQSPGAALTFTATINGQEYVNNTDINPALAAGTSYEYTITVNKTGLTVSGCTISAWSDGGSNSGNASMQ